MIGAVRGSGPGNTEAIVKAGQRSVSSIVQAHQLAVQLVKNAQGAPRIRPQGGGALSGTSHPQGLGRRLDRRA